MIESSISARNVKEKGLITWLDEEREAQTIASLSPTQLMMDGICGTQVVLVFITKRYIELVSECFQQSDLDTIMGPVIRDNQTTSSQVKERRVLQKPRLGEATTCAHMMRRNFSSGSTME